MLSTAPNQIVGSSDAPYRSFRTCVAVYADFVQGYPIAAKFRQYAYFLCK